MRAQKWICSHWCVLLRRDYYLHQGLSETACKNLFGFSTLCKLVALASRAELWCELKWRLSRLSGEVEALQSKLVTKETVSKPVLCAQGVCPTTQVGGCLQFIAMQFMLHFPMQFMLHFAMYFMFCIYFTVWLLHFAILYMNVPRSVPNYQVDGCPQCTSLQSCWICTSYILQWLKHFRLYYFTLSHITKQFGSY